MDDLLQKQIARKMRYNYYGGERGGHGNTSIGKQLPVFLVVIRVLYERREPDEWLSCANSHKHCDKIAKD